MKLKCLFVTVCSVWLFSCGKDDPTPPPTEVDRTVLFYLMGDNNGLASSMTADIEEAKSGMRNVGERGNLIVYRDISGRPPQLLELNRDGTETLIAEYEAENSASAATVSRVLADVVRMFPARSYGLILSSHGTGWLPRSSSSSKSKTIQYEHAFSDRVSGAYNREGYLRTKWLGMDGSSRSYMDVSEWADVLPKNRFFDFILLDACLMGGVEVAYELRDNARYIIASPAEVLVAGFPYDRVVPLFFEQTLRLEKVCEAFVASYDDYATVSLVETDGLETLAEITGQIMASSGSTLADVSGIQVYRSYPNNVFFDLTDYIRKIAPASLYNRFTEQMDRTVVYKASTPHAYSEQGGGVYDVTSFSGLSSFIAIPGYQEDYRRAYADLEWAEAIGYEYQ